MRKKIKHLTILLFAPCLLFAQSVPNQKFSLDSCILYAFENSPFLKANEKSIDIAKKGIGISKSAGYPTVALTGNAQLTDMYESLDEYSNSYLALEVSQPIWQNGKIRIQNKIAQTNKEIASMQFEIEKQNLVFTITQQYLNLLRYSQLEGLSNQMASRIAVNAESALERQKLGVAKKSDVLRAETRLSDARILEKRFQTLKEVSVQNLKKAIGHNLPVKIQPADSLHKINEFYLKIGVDSFLIRAKETLPEFQIVEYRLTEQGYRITYNKRQNLPEFNAYAGYNWNDSPVLNNELYGYAGISMNFKLFDGFAKKNRVAKEKIRLEQVNNEYEDLRLIIASEIQQAYLSLSEAQLQIKNSLKQLESATENQKMVMEEYKMGTSSMLELLDAENDYFGAQQNYINALWAYRVAEATIERKSGIFKY